MLFSDHVEAGAGDGTFAPWRTSAIWISWVHCGDAQGNGVAVYLRPDEQFQHQLVIATERDRSRRALTTFRIGTAESCTVLAGCYVHIVQICIVVPEVVMVERVGPGAGRRQVVVPAQSGRAVGVRRGDLVSVVDIEGHQVGDMWAVDAADHGCWLSVSHTRDRCERLFPAVGGQFCDQRGKPVLELAGDTSPGVHDMLFPPCDRWLYESRGLAGHPNCRDNFLAAAASAGIVLAAVPDPVNLFQNSGPRSDGTLAIGVAASSPGDAIAFIARRDLVVILTACSVDYPPLNQGHCSPLRIEITPAAAP